MFFNRSVTLECNTCSAPSLLPFLSADLHVVEKCSIYIETSSRQFQNLTTFLSFMTGRGLMENRPYSEWLLTSLKIHIFLKHMRAHSSIFFLSFSLSFSLLFSFHQPPSILIVLTGSHHVLNDHLKPESGADVIGQFRRNKHQLPRMSRCEGHGKLPLFCF